MQNTLATNPRHSTSKHPQLHTPKPTQISKQQYRKFHFIRTLNSPLLGQHSLLCHNHKKYISKQLPIACTQFKTMRPLNQVIYHYSQQCKNVYIFQIMGEPLIDLWRNYHNIEIKEWLDKVGGIQNCMIQFIRFCVKMYAECEISDVVAEGFRVIDGRLVYCYDTWMKSSYLIVAQNNLQIQSYFLSEPQLTQLQTNPKQPFTQSLPYKQFLFKLGLLILSFCLPQVKIRNYEYCQYKLNKQNIQQKLQLFKIKTNNKQLLNLVVKFVNCQVQTMEQIWKFIDNGNNNNNHNNNRRGQSPHISSVNKSVNKGKNSAVKENSFVGELPNAGNTNAHYRKLSTVTKTTAKKIKLRNKSGNINQSSFLTQSPSNAKNIQPLSFQQSTMIHSSNPHSNPNAKLSLKQALSQPLPISPIPMLQYLHLSQYIPQNLYQQSLISALQPLRTDPDWQHKIYANGSIYIGDLLPINNNNNNNNNNNGSGVNEGLISKNNNNSSSSSINTNTNNSNNINNNVNVNMNMKREGKGLYLFDSQDLYVGDWKDNTMSGYGKYVFKSGQVYQGQLTKGIKTGFGKFTYKDGRIYEGHWRNNVKIGFGTVVFPNGTKFMGFFNKKQQTYGLFTSLNTQNELYQTQGCLQSYNWQSNTFTHPSSSSFAPKLKQCNPSLYIPCLRSQDGSKYCGQSIQNQPSGYGVKQNEKQIYEGYWKNGKMHGQGKIVLKNKYQIQGVWEEGLLIQYKYK